MASTCSTMAMLARTREPVAGSRMLIMVATTSSAEHGLPLWNLTPPRSLKVHTLRSSEADQLTARSGLVVRSRSIRVSPLKTRCTKMYSSPMVVLAGSRVLSEVPTATRSVPWASAGAARPAASAAAMSIRRIVFFLLAATRKWSLSLASEASLNIGQQASGRAQAVGTRHAHWRQRARAPRVWERDQGDRNDAAARAWVRTMWRYSSIATHSSGLAMLLGVQP